MSHMKNISKVADRAQRGLRNLSGREAIVQP